MMTNAFSTKRIEFVPIVDDKGIQIATMKKTITEEIEMISGCCYEEGEIK